MAGDLADARRRRDPGAGGGMGPEMPWSGGCGLDGFHWFDGFFVSGQGVYVTLALSR